MVEVRLKEEKNKLLVRFEKGERGALKVLEVPRPKGPPLRPEYLRTCLKEEDTEETTRGPTLKIVFH